jgi:hypothetical protein
MLREVQSGSLIQPKALFPRKRSLGTAAAAEIAATKITSRGKDRNVLVTICSGSISDAYLL